MKRFVLEKEQYGKLFLIGTTLLIWVLLIVSFNVNGYRETWEFWRVPTAQHVFLDFRLIPGSAESFRNGYEPTVENPYDPAGRIFNYPAFWRLFFYTGITSADTMWIGIGMNILFFIGVFLFPKKLTIPAAVGMLFVIFSPASMLLYERANVDLVVFLICALIVVAESYSANLAALFIVLGSIVKLFPFFGITVLLKEAKNRFLMLFAVCFLSLIAYMLATADSVNAAWNRTMRGSDLSYGTNVFAARFVVAITNIFSQWLSSEQLDLLLKYGSLAVGLVTVLVVSSLTVTNMATIETSTEQNLAAFRMGASIYVGTFLLGNNWDYRLAFLVLVVPQLVEWMRTSNRTFSIIAKVCLVVLYLSCWYFIAWFSPVISSSPDRAKLLFIFDEASNWILMAALAYLLVASTPNWLREQVTNILPKRSVPSTQS